MHPGPSKEGGGGSPHPFPSQSTMGSFSHWFLTLSRDPLFLYKNHRPISCFKLMDDPVLSPEAQQVILMKRNTHQNGIGRIGLISFL